jgi:hypothetical protein
MSVYPATSNFLINQTNPLAKTLQSAGLPVYVHLLMNEFPSQPWDFFSDATTQINAFVQKGGGGVDGVITDFPGTAHRYKCTLSVTFSCSALHPLLTGSRCIICSHCILDFICAVNSCKNMGDKTPYYMLPPQRGGLLETIDKAAQPPAMAPQKDLASAEVVEAALPPASSTTAPASSHGTSRIRTDVSFLATLLMLCAYLLI